MASLSRWRHRIGDTLHPERRACRLAWRGLPRRTYGPVRVRVEASGAIGIVGAFAMALNGVRSVARQHTAGARWLRDLGKVELVDTDPTSITHVLWDREPTFVVPGTTSIVLLRVGDDLLPVREGGPPGEVFRLESFDWRGEHLIPRADATFEDVRALGSWILTSDALGWSERLHR